VSSVTEPIEYHRARLSLGRKGQCWDNAVAESFFATIKAELLDRQSRPTRNAVNTAIFEYVEDRYNTRRLHCSLGYLNPATYENSYLPAGNDPGRQVA
jgi:putative transposase